MTKLPFRKLLSVRRADWSSGLCSRWTLLFWPLGCDWCKEGEAWSWSCWLFWLLVVVGGPLRVRPRFGAACRWAAAVRWRLWRRGLGQVGWPAAGCCCSGSGFCCCCSRSGFCCCCSRSGFCCCCSRSGFCCCCCCCGRVGVGVVGVGVGVGGWLALGLGVWYEAAGRGGAVGADLALLGMAVMALESLVVYTCCYNCCCCCCSDLV